MKIKFPGIFPLCVSTLLLLLFVSCGPVVPVVTDSPVPTVTFTPAYNLTAEAAATFSASETEAVMTALTSETLSTIPSNTPPGGATVIPIPGDLGWGAVHGKIVDGVTNLPIDRATVECEHFSYTSPSLCHGVTTTNSEGLYVFLGVFFHDTDRITLLVEAPGYTPLRFEQSFFTQPDFRADLKLFPATGDTLTATPFLMCTPPSCQSGVLTCGDPKGCPGGCGTICVTATPTY